MSIFFKKFLSVLLVVCFSATSGGSIPSVFAQDTVTIPDKPISFSIKDMVLPEVLGSIQDLYQSAVSVTPEPSAKETKLIVEIQDAHGILEAQENIRGIIQLLQDKYGLNTIGLEGGVGRVSSAVYRSLPDPVIKEKIVTDYLKRGELSGGEAAMILNPKVGNYYGIENKDLYFKNRDAFLNALRVRPSILKSLDKLTTKLDSIRSTVYSPELISFDNKSKDFQDERLTLMDYSSILKAEAEKLGLITPPAPLTLRGEKAGEAFSARYPSLNTLFTAQAKDKEMETNESLKQQGIHFIREIEPLVQKDLNPEEIRIFNSKLQDYQTGTLDQVAFLQYLHTKAKEHSIPLDQYQDIQNYFSYREKLQTLEGDKLFTEIKLLTQEIKRTLSKTQEALELDSIYDHITLIRKLAKLEALHEDLNQYEANPQDYTPDFFNKYLAKYQDRFTDSWELSASQDFYRYARERDQVLFDNFLKALKDQKTSQGILVTGGFHTEGLKLKFKDAGYSYLILSPKISRFDTENPYEKVMSGNLSYLTPQKSKLQVVLATAGLDKDQQDAFIRSFIQNGIKTEEADQAKQKLIQTFGKQWVDNFIKLYQGENGILADPSQYIKLITDSLKTIGVPETPELDQALSKASSAALQAIIQAVTHDQEIFVRGINRLKTQFQDAKLSNEAQTRLFQVYIETLVSSEQGRDVPKKITDANALITQLVNASNDPAILNAYKILLTEGNLKENISILNLNVLPQAQEYVARLKTPAARAAALGAVEAIAKTQKVQAASLGKSTGSDSLGDRQIQNELRDDFDIASVIFRSGVQRAGGDYQDHLRFISAVAIQLTEGDLDKAVKQLTKTTQPVSLTQKEAEVFLAALKEYKDKYLNAKRGDSQRTSLYTAINSLSTSLVFNDLAPSIRHRYFSTKNKYAVQRQWQDDLFDLTTRGRGITSDIEFMLEPASKIKDGVTFPIVTTARPSAEGSSLGETDLIVEKTFLEEAMKAQEIGQAPEIYRNYQEVINYLRALEAAIPSFNTLVPAEFQTYLHGFIEHYSAAMEASEKNFGFNIAALNESYGPGQAEVEFYQPLRKIMTFFLINEVKEFTTVPAGLQKGARPLVEQLKANPMLWRSVRYGYLTDEIQKLQAGAKSLGGVVLRADRQTGRINHQNRSEEQPILPASMFGGDNVNFISVLERAATGVLGYAPILSIVGSYTYALTREGKPDWQFISDLDLRIHTPKKSSKDQMRQIQIAFFKALRQKGVSLDIPGIDEQDASLQSSQAQNWSLVERTTGKKYVVQFLSAGEDELMDKAIDQSPFNSYRFTDQFYGNTEQLNNILSKAGLDKILQRNVGYYQMLLKQIKEDSQYTKMGNYLKPRQLKLLYQLSVMRGRGDEFKWLLEEFQKLDESFDEQEFKKNYEKAMAGDRGLDIANRQQEQVLSGDLRKMVEIGSVSSASSLSKSLGQSLGWQFWKTVTPENLRKAAVLMKEGDGYLTRGDFQKTLAIYKDADRLLTGRLQNQDRGFLLDYEVLRDWLDSDLPAVKRLAKNYPSRTIDPKSFDTNTPGTTYAGRLEGTHLYLRQLITKTPAVGANVTPLIVDVGVGETGTTTKELADDIGQARVLGVDLVIPQIAVYVAQTTATPAYTAFFDKQGHFLYGYTPEEVTLTPGQIEKAYALRESFLRRRQALLRPGLETKDEQGNQITYQPLSKYENTNLEFREGSMFNLPLKDTERGGKADLIRLFNVMQYYFNREEEIKKALADKLQTSGYLVIGDVNRGYGRQGQMEFLTYEKLSDGSLKPLTLGTRIYFPGDNQDVGDSMVAGGAGTENLFRRYTDIWKLTLNDSARLIWHQASPAERTDKSLLVGRLLKRLHAEGYRVTLYGDQTLVFDINEKGEPIQTGAAGKSLGAEAWQDSGRMIPATPQEDFTGWAKRFYSDFEAAIQKYPDISDDLEEIFGLWSHLSVNSFDAIQTMKNEPFYSGAMTSEILVTPNGTLVMSLTDNGIGIPDHSLEYLLETKLTTKIRMEGADTMGGKGQAMADVGEMLAQRYPDSSVMIETKYLRDETANRKLYISSQRKGFVLPMPDTEWQAIGMDHGTRITISVPLASAKSYAGTTVIRESWSPTSTFAKELIQILDSAGAPIGMLELYKRFRQSRGERPEDFKKLSQDSFVLDIANLNQILDQAPALGNHSKLIRDLRVVSPSSEEPREGASLGQAVLGVRAAAVGMEARNILREPIMGTVQIPLGEMGDIEIENKISEGYEVNYKLTFKKIGESLQVEVDALEEQDKAITTRALKYMIQPSRPEDSKLGPRIATRVSNLTIRFDGENVVLINDKLDTEVPTMWVNRITAPTGIQKIEAKVAAASLGKDEKIVLTAEEVKARKEILDRLLESKDQKMSKTEFSDIYRHGLGGIYMMLQLADTIGKFEVVTEDVSRSVSVINDFLGQGINAYKKPKESVAGWYLAERVAGGLIASSESKKFTEEQMKEVAGFRDRLTSISDQIVHLNAQIRSRLATAAASLGQGYPSIDFGQAIEYSGIKPDERKNLEAHGARFMTATDFFEKESTEKGGYILGLTTYQDHPVIDPLGQELGLTSWLAAYREMYGAAEERTEEFMDFITAQAEKTGEKIVFFVPVLPIVQVQVEETTTQKELQWLADHPERAKNVIFAFGLYDLFSPKLKTSIFSFGTKPTETSFIEVLKPLMAKRVKPDPQYGKAQRARHELYKLSLKPSVAAGASLGASIPLSAGTVEVVSVTKDKTAYFALPQNWGGKAVSVQDVLVRDDEELESMRFRVQMAPNEKSGVPEDLLVKLAASSRKSLAQIGSIEDNCYDVSSQLAKNLKALFPKAGTNDIVIIGNQLLIARSHAIDFPPDWDNATKWADHYVTYFKVGNSYYAIDLTASQYLGAEGQYAGEIFEASSDEDLRTMLSAYYGGLEDLWNKVTLEEVAQLKTALVRAKDLRPQFNEMAALLTSALTKEGMDENAAQKEAARMFHPFLAPDLTSVSDLADVMADLALRPNGVGFQKFREWSDLPGELMVDEVLRSAAQHAREKLFFTVVVRPSLGDKMTRELYLDYGSRFSQWELRSLAEYFAEHGTQDIEKMFSQVNGEIIKRLNAPAASKVVTDMMNDAIERRLSNTEGLAKYLRVLGFSEPLTREIALRIQEPIERAVLSVEEVEASSLGTDRVNELKGEMMEDPAAVRRVLQDWKSGFSLGLKAPAERIRTPLSLQITQLVSWDEIRAITEFVGVENISIVLHLNPAQKEDPAFKKLLAEVKQFTLMNPKFNFKITPASENAKSLKVTRNISSPVYDDNTKFLVLAGDQALGEEIQGNIPARAQGKTLVVAYRNTGINELDTMLLEVFSQALLGTAKPTEYLKQALIGLIKIDRGVVIPIIDAIINKFERDLAQTQAQAIAA